MMQSYSVLAASSVVAIKEKEIVTIKLDEGHEVVTLNKGEGFFHPKSLNIKSGLLIKI